MKILRNLFLTAAAFFLVSCRFPNQNEAFYSIRIGVILPLSGEDAALGKNALDGMELAVRKANRKGGVDFRKVQLIIKNSAGDPAKAAQFAREMIENDNVVALLGAYNSAEALQLKFIAESERVPFVAAMSTNETLVHKAKYTFQSTLNDEIQGAALAYYIANKCRFKNPVFMLNTDIGAIYQRGVALRAAQAWADFAKREPVRMTYSSSMKSFEPLIKKCIREDIDLIVLPDFPKTAKRFILEARRLGYNGAFGGSDSYDHPEITNSSEKLGSCFFSTPYHINGKSDENIEFKELMQSEFKRLPSFAEAMGYDGMNFVLKALRGAYTPDEIAANMKNMRSFYSVSGTMLYHPHKELMLHPVFIMEVVGSKRKTVCRWTVDSEQLKNYRNREED